MGQEDLYRKFIKTQNYLKNNLKLNKSMKELKNFSKNRNEDAKYYPSAIEQKEKV